VAAVTIELPRAELEEACEALFGSRDLSEHRADDWPRRLRSAFRRRVFETHPDRALSLGRSPEALRAEFSLVNEAYRLLSSLPQQPVALRPRRAPARARPQEPAVHGASGRPAAPWPAPPRPCPARPATTGERQADRFHDGPLPARRLRLGEYLYYSRLVSWRTLIDALSWQQAHHRLLGQLAVQQGCLTPQRLSSLLVRHRVERRRGQRLGDLLVRCGAITGSQLQVLLWRQERQRPALGGWFLERGLCTGEQLEEIVRWQSAWGRR
jgi:hypothetical protein